MPEQLPLDSGDRVIVAGASGLIGRALVASLRSRGAQVTQLVRRAPAAPGEVQWDPARGLDAAVLRNARAVVVLNGATVGRLPWTPRYKSELLWSRLSPVRAVTSAIDRLGTDAPHLITASAVGYYGSRPGERVDENSAAGDGFVPELCTQIEDAALRVSDITTVTPLRIAPLIHREALLKPLIPLTKFGLAGPLAGGRQLWSWMSLPDAIAAIEHVIAHRLSGPVNLVGPTTATANDIGFALAVELNRPFILRAPAFALRAALGDAADSLLLNDTAVVPSVLEATGFRWQHTSAEDAVVAAVREDATS